MTLVNNNLKMIDRPIWEQLTPAPASTAAAVAIVDDNVRYIYALFSATSFWCHDTWTDTWIQLANPPGGTLAAGSCMRYMRQMGSQINGEVFGSVYALIASGSAVVFYRYDIATNTWSSALSVTNIPAAWGTDGRIGCPDPAMNGNAGGYHTGILIPVTASAQALAGATTISVNALAAALPANAVLNFGTATAPIYAVLTAAAAAAATSITVSPLVATVAASAVAYFYPDIFLVGNNATVAYRYNIASNAWLTTSANSGNPALGAVPGAVGAGCVLCWLPGSGDANALDRLILVRGGATASIYEYSLSTNAWSSLTYYPHTETFTTGSSSGIRVDATGKNTKLLMQKDATGRVLEFDRKRLRMDGRCTQTLIAQGAAVVGDKATLLRSPDGIEFLYTLLNTSTYFVRAAVLS